MLNYPVSNEEQKKNYTLGLIFFSLERDHLVIFDKNSADLGLWALCSSCTGQKATTEQSHPSAVFF